MYLENNMYYPISRFGKVPVGLLALGFLFILILVSDAEAQTTFSTGWGKRSQNILIKSSGTECLSQSRLSLEQLLKLYNFIQVRY